MAYNPGIQPIGGQLIGQGLAGGLGGLAQGIMQRAAKRREKEQLDGAIKTLQPLLDQMAPEAGVRLDKDLPKEAIPQIIQIAGQIDQQKREAPLQQLRIDNEKLRQRLSQQELDTAAKDAAALEAAALPLQSGDARAALATYSAKGGRDPRVLAQLGDLAMNAAKPQPMIFASEADLEKTYPAARYDYKMTPDPATGRVRVDNLSPRAAPQTPPPGKFREVLDEGIAKQVSGVVERVPEYNSTLESVQRAREALKAGAQTGGLAALKLNAAQAVNGIFGTQVFDTKSAELAKSSFADMAVTAASRLKGQGQITEAERKLLTETVANMGNSPQAAIYIMDYMEAAAQRNLAKAAALQELRDSGNNDAAGYSRILTTWEKQNPIQIKPAGQSAATQPAASSADSLAAKWLQKK